MSRRARRRLGLLWRHAAGAFIAVPSSRAGAFSSSIFSADLRRDRIY